MDTKKTKYYVLVDGEIWATFKYMTDAKNYGAILEDTYRNEKSITYIEVEK